MRYLLLLLIFTTACKTRCRDNFLVGSDFCSNIRAAPSGLYIYNCQSGFTYHNPPVYRKICEDDSVGDKK